MYQRARSRLLSPGTVLILIILLGALLRFHRITYQSLYIDELISWARSNYPTPGEVIADTASSKWSPAYFLLLYGSIHIIGDSELALRIPAALIGTLSIAAIYVMGTRLFDRRVGLVASAMMAVAQAPLLYSQEVRGYTLLTLTTILSTYFWYRILQTLHAGKRPPFTLSMAYGILALTCAYTHHYGLLAIVLQGLAAGLQFLRRPKQLRSLTVVYAVLAVAYLPWALQLWEAFGSSSAWIQRPRGWLVTLLYFIEFSFNSSEVYTAMALGLVTLVFGLRFVRWRHSGPSLTGQTLLLNPYVLLAGWLLIPFSIVWVKSVLSSPALIFKYVMHFILPASHLIVARAIVPQRDSPGTMPLLVATTIALLLGNVIFGWHFYTSVAPHREQIRETVECLADHPKLLDENTLVVSSVSQHLINYYLDMSGLDPSEQIFDIIAYLASDIPDIEKAIQQQTPEYVMYVVIHTPADPAVIEYFEQNFAEVEHRDDWQKGEVWLFKVP